MRKGRLNNPLWVKIIEERQFYREHLRKTNETAEILKGMIKHGEVIELDKFRREDIH